MEEKKNSRLRSKTHQCKKTFSSYRTASTNVLFQEAERKKKKSARLAKKFFSSRARLRMIDGRKIEFCCEMKQKFPNWRNVREKEEKAKGESDANKAGARNALN